MKRQTMNALVFALMQNTLTGFDKQINEGKRLNLRIIEKLESDDKAVGAAQLAQSLICPDKDRQDDVKPRRMLSSVFTHMNGYHPNKYIPIAPENGSLRMPLSKLPRGDFESEYRELWGHLKVALQEADCSAAGIQDLLQTLEMWSSCVPANLCGGAEADVSLYDESKLLAAVTSCVVEYLHAAHGTIPQITELESLRETQMFLLYSADFSGIQKFIYTVSTENALRTLRSRSFVLELLLEHFLDELLSACGVSRTNLLYTGGGHCYALLPNTLQAVEACRKWSGRMNDWLRERFGTLLYLAAGWTACSANELNNTPEKEQPYQAIFQRVASTIAEQKLHRYNAAQLLSLNRQSRESEGRECRICGNTERLKDDVCPTCLFFEQVSKEIQTKELILITDTPLAKTFLPIPAIDHNVCLQFVRPNEIGCAADVRRAYRKRSSTVCYPGAIQLSVGDYASGNQMSDFSISAKGISRIAVCRMDVDNLGQAFVSGFASDDSSGKTVSLMRTSAFSRQLSLFFKQYINDILSGRYLNRKALNVSIVYSGGDDVFLVGAWSDVIQGATRIQEAFQTFSCDSLTISGGIGVFHDHYPIRIAAAETGDLEDSAKSNPGKSSVTLFEAGEEHTYHWDEFCGKVMGEKLRLLQSFFEKQKDRGNQQERGNSFLYRLLQLLRASGDQRINLARYAYLLSRLEPPKKNPVWKDYRAFADQMYLWALQPEDRRQLVTAIYIYVYENRKSG